MEEISVIVTTYDRKEFLTETLNSILKQTFKDFELIVVDNYSNYDFLAHIKTFNDERIRPFQNKNNGIIAENRNFGIKKARGKYLAFCDDDDIWMGKKLEVQIDRIKQNGSDLVSSNMILFKNNINNIVGKQKNRLVRNFNELLKTNQINTSTVLVKRSELVYFSCDKVLLTIEDYALWLNLYSNGFKFDFINEPMIYYRVSESMSQKDWVTKHLRTIYLLIAIKLEFGNSKVLKSISMHFFKYFLKTICIFANVRNNKMINKK